MLFNSFSFFIFFVITFFCYWIILRNKLRWQNTFLLIASYVFYGWWDWRFLILIFISTIVDFLVGKALSNETRNNRNKLLLAISISVNLGMLFFFKYYNFFVESWVELWQSLGVRVNLSSMNIILPVGISFYTFQTLSYTIDVYKKKISSTNNFIEFATFVAFFPQLVAGPIERAKTLLPQFSKKREFNKDNAISGLYLFIWGFFKKVVIADTCATYVDVIFSDYQNMNSLSLILGTVYFAFQIYGDFSGYSDMAIGIARMLGFDLMRNFNYPYFARDIGEFWRRWHISLSTWFRDYLYIPLGGSRVNVKNKIRNVFIIFVVSGFWHGANWTFIVWGALNALYFLPLMLAKSNRKNQGNAVVHLSWDGMKTVLHIVLTFSLTCFAWIFFRANDLNHAAGYIGRTLTENSFNLQFLSIERYNVELIFILFLLVIIEWFHRKFEHPLVGKYKFGKASIIVILTIVLGVYSEHKDFIYFQF